MNRISAAILALALLLSIQTSAHEASQDQIAQLNSAILEDPEDPDLFLKRGAIYQEIGEWKKAAEDYDLAQKFSTQENPDLDLARAGLLFDMGKFSAAQTELNRCLKKYPTYLNAYLLRARTFVRLGSFTAAISDYDIVLKSSSEPEYFVERAEAWQSNGNIGAALSGLEEGIRKLGPIVSLELKAVDLELEQKKFQSALNRIDFLVHHSARKENWLLIKGNILEKAGRPKEAKQVYRKALNAIASLPIELRNTAAMKDLTKQLDALLLY